MTETVGLTLDEVRTLAVQVLRRHGVSEAHAEGIADVLAASERDGCAAHGLYRLLGCVETLSAGKVSPTALPIIEEVAPSLLRVDAQGAFYPLSHQRALPVFIDMVRTQGMGALAIRHCVHFAALWCDIEPLVAAGLVVQAYTPSHAWVTPHGGKRPLLGTNPIAFGWPRPSGHPFIFDFATSAIARGEISLHQRAGKPLPEGWGIDRNGTPSTDAEAVLAGAMLPFGGHKGSALSMMVELIAGPLIDDMTSQESLAFDGGKGHTLPMGGVLIVAFDPRRFLGDHAEAAFTRAEALFADVQADGARLPSQRRYAARAKHLETGVIEVPRALYDELQALR